MSGQTHEFRADGSIEVSGAEMVYDANKAVNACAYSDAAQRSVGRSGALSDTRAKLAAREAQTTKMSKQQLKALKFQRMMHAKFGKEVESQLQADDDHEGSAERQSVAYAGGITK